MSRTVRSTFVPWWRPWARCRRKRHWTDDMGPVVLRCRRPRRHTGDHACPDGRFGVRFFHADPS